MYGYCSIPDDQPCSSSDELTFINMNCELQQNGSQTNVDFRNNDDSMHCSRAFVRNVYRAEYSSMRRTAPLNERSIDVISLNGSERGVDIPSPVHTLPPRPPSRSNSAGHSAHNRLPPPPTYQSKNCIKQPTVSNKPPPPPYKGRVMPPTKRTTEFPPKEASTPESEHNKSALYPEDEKRNVIRNKAERNEKTISIYENVDHNDASLSPELGTVWYEYGCV
uniref:Uncharacterized protein n=1 Tax=Elaeophora elaphi TaxID=1147741 RepID=A0A0R3S1J8_9BILA